MFRSHMLVLLATLAVCLVAGRGVCASEVTDLKAKLEASKQQADQEKDKAKKEELKKQEKQLKADLDAAKEREKVAAKAAEKAKEGKKDKVETAEAGKSEAKGFNKFSRFWTEEVGRPMRNFFHGN